MTRLLLVLASLASLASLAGCAGTPVATSSSDDPDEPPAPAPDPLGLCTMNHGLGPSGICAGRDTTFRIATYNLNFGLGGDPDGLAAIDQLGADVVLLQESNDAWQAALDHDGRYPYRRFGAPEGWPASGLGVLSRFPIEQVDQLPATAGPFFAWRIVVRTPGGPVQVLDVHLRPPISDRGSWVVGYFTTPAVRAREIADRLAVLDPALPAIVAGDFNETLDGRAIGVLRDRGFSDAVGRPGEPTWHWPLGAIELRQDFDHIFTDAHFHALASGIVHAGRSDHWPVWADLALEHAR